MQVIKTEFEGLYIINNFFVRDKRGSFIKVFSEDIFRQEGIIFEPKEIYYSISKKNVLRGMHFQSPPADHHKLIFVASGSIVDVVLDIRKYSRTYGKYYSIKIDNSKTSLLISQGFAHGFLALEDNTVVVYNQTSTYNRDNDVGIAWNSFGYDWNNVKPILSSRDKTFPVFNNYSTPFNKR